MPNLQSADVGYIGDGETRQAQVSFDNLLASGETLTGSPTVEEISTSDLTIDSVTISVAALTINGVSVSAGRALTFFISGGTAGSHYRVRITADTSVSQVLQGILALQFLSSD